MRGRGAEASSRRSTLTRAGILFLGVGCLVLSSCSSRTSSDSAKTTQASPPGNLQAVKASVAKLEQRPTSIGITTPIGAIIPKGKTIDYLECGSPECVYTADSVTQAASVLGWKVKVINTGLTASTIYDAYAQAFRDHPSAVIEGGFNRQQAGPFVKDFEKDHIPLIEAFVADAVGNGVTAVIYNEYQTQGEQLAEWTYADDNGQKDVNVAVSVAPLFDISNEVYDGFKSEFTKLCPSCSVHAIDIPGSEVGSSAQASAVAAYFRAHPGTKYFMATFVDLSTGVPVALQQAGITGVKIETLDMNTTALEQLQTGQLSVIAGLSVPEVAWRAVDTLARLFAGKPYSVTAEAPFPLMLLTKSNEVSISHLFPLVANYQSEYKALWGGR